MDLMDLKRATIANMRLLDSSYFSHFFKDQPKAAETVLRIILGKKDIAVKEVCTEVKLTNIHGHEVVMDCVAVEKNGNFIDIEVQRARQGVSVRRARYYSDLLGAQALMKGEKYEERRDTYIIFICDFDMLGNKLPIEHLGTFSKETGSYIDDGSMIIFVNAGCADDGTELGTLMADFRCTDPDNMRYSVLRERSREIKNTEKGIKEMDKVIEEIMKPYMDERINALSELRAREMAQNMAQNMAQDIAQDIAQNIAQDIAQQRVNDVAVNMLAAGRYSPSEISELTKIPLSEIEKLKAGCAIR